MADAEERVGLAGQDAVTLWQRGRCACNAWVAAVKATYCTVPFVFIKLARPAAAMFTDPVHALIMTQQGLRYIFLFLLGVSLRNRLCF